MDSSTPDAPPPPAPRPGRDPAIRTQAAGLDLDWVKVDEVDEFVEKTDAYVRGELDPDAYRAYRLTRGVYGQRQDDVYMMRIKIPGGMLAPDQARLIAGLIDEAPLRQGNVTTRTNIQIHHIPLATVPQWKARLNAGGVTQIDACGNAVRTVTQDPYAGLAPDEVFDTTPYLQGITRALLNNPRARLLPRKFKIALSTSEADRGLAAIHDVGLIAVRGPDGGPAFRVAVGGGLAALPVSALVLHEAWPAQQILTPILAVIDLFQDHGNRKVRSKARVKHVLRKYKEEKFSALYRDYLAKVEADPPPPLAVQSELFTPTRWELAAPDDDLAQQRGYADWFRSSVEPTRLPGRVFVTVRLDQGGKLRGDDLRLLADLCERYGEGKLHLTQQQNALLRGVAVAALPELWRALDAGGLARPGALWASKVTSCPGTTTCNLGITHSRNLADLVQAQLADRQDRDLTVKISGCHNACGQHHIGTIGFYGAVRRLDTRAAPHYRLLVGGHVHGGVARFGESLGLVPARRAPLAVERLLAWADAHRGEGQSAADALLAAPLPTLQAVVGDLIEPPELDEEDFVDIGLDEAFHVISRAGECAA
jgi:sulfite reductase beta subunit-like hemoprotein